MLCALKLLPVTPRHSPETLFTSISTVMHIYDELVSEEVCGVRVPTCTVQVYPQGFA